MQLRSILGLALALCTVPVASAFDNETTHRAMAQIVVDKGPSLNAMFGLFLTDPNLFNGFGSTLGGPTLGEDFVRGAVDEDCGWLGPTICLQHFYDGLRGLGLSDYSFMEFINWIIVGGFGWRTNSLDWAYRDYLHSTTWYEARQDYYRALTSSDPGDRITKASNVMNSLGAVCHLLQDLAQPQHTRNDAHKDEVAPMEGFETYCSQQYGSVAQIEALSPGGWLLYPLTPVHRVNWNVPLEMQVFWSKGIYTGREKTPPSISRMWGLAEYSNRYYVTTDTMFVGQPSVFQFKGATIQFKHRYSLMHSYPFPCLEETDLQPVAGQTYRIDEGRVDPLATGLDVWIHHSDKDYNIGSTFTLVPIPGVANGYRATLTNADFERAAQDLVPMAVEASVGLVDTFFRGRLDYDIQDDPSASVCRLSIKNQTSHWPGASENTDLLRGTFSLYQDDNNGQRILRTLQTDSFADLLYDESVNATFYPKPWLGQRFVLVFRGQVGTEHDSAAGRGLTLRQTGMSARLTSETRGVIGLFPGAPWVSDIDLVTPEFWYSANDMPGWATLENVQNKTTYVANRGFHLLVNGVMESCTGTVSITLTDGSNNSATGSTLQADAVKIKLEGNLRYSGEPVSYSKTWTGATSGFVRPLVTNQ